MPTFSDPFDAVEYLTEDLNKTREELRVIRLVLSMLIYQLRNNLPVERIDALEKLADQQTDPEAFRELIRDILLNDDSKSAELLKFPVPPE